MSRSFRVTRGFVTIFSSTSKRVTPMPKSPKSRREGVTFPASTSSVGRARGETITQLEADHSIYGLIPVLEALRSGQRPLQQITIAEGARHERLKELLELAKLARVPVHRAP